MTSLLSRRCCGLLATTFLWAALAHGEEPKSDESKTLAAGQSLFNGRDLRGWKPVGGGQWQVVDGILVGKSPASEKRHGLLLSEKSYGDFTARIVFRIRAGNSGFYFHSQPVEQAVGIHGVQAELENSELVGGLYETGGRAWIAKPLNYLESLPPERRGKREKQWQQVVSELDGEQWTTMVVSVHGDRIVTHVGDTLACDLRDDKVAKQGVFALQLHGNQDMHVEIKSVELLSKQAE